MNIFTNLLSLHGYVTDPHLLDDDRDERYASEFGNQAAARKFFGSFGHARTDAARNSEPLSVPRAIEGCR